MSNQLTNPLGGRGTAGTITKWTSPTTVGNSLLSESGTTITSAATAETFTNAQTWTLATSTSALNIQSGLLNLDTTNSRVGIGTASPWGALTVARAATFDAYVECGGGGRTAATSAFFGQDSAGSAYLWNRTNATVYIGVNNAISATFTSTGLAVTGTITSTGNVGAGTANGTARLESRKATSDTVLRSNAQVGFGDWDILGAGLIGQQLLSSPYAFALQACNATNTTRFPISLNPSGGDVGIGTTSPSSLGAGYTTLDIRGSSGGGFKFGNNTQYAYAYSDSSGFALSTQTNLPLNFYTNNAQLRASVGSTSLDISSTSNYGLKLQSTPGNTDPNTLDSYFEAPAAATAGNGWTPTLSAAGTWGGVLPVVTYARYVRVGSIIFVHVQLTGAALTVAAFGAATITMPTGISINTYANQAVVTTNTDVGGSGTGVAGAGNIYSPAFAACTRVTYQFCYFTN